MDYEMTEEDLKALLEACRPVPLIALQCGMPASPQARANAAWGKLGEKMGFDGMTVRPNGKGDRFFSAEPVPLKPGTEEGAKCNRDGCLGVMQYIRQDDCSCHINPPCSACVDAPLICNSCGADTEDEAEGK